MVFGYRLEPANSLVLQGKPFLYRVSEIMSAIFFELSWKCRDFNPTLNIFLAFLFILILFIGIFDEFFILIGLLFTILQPRVYNGEAWSVSFILHLSLLIYFHIRANPNRSQIKPVQLKVSSNRLELYFWNQNVC